MKTAEIGQLLKQASAQLRDLSEQNTQLSAQVSGFERGIRAEKIVEKMISRGLVPEENRAEKVAEFKDKEDLSVLEKAVEISTPEELAKIASVSSPSVVGETSDEVGHSALESFLLGSE